MFVKDADGKLRAATPAEMANPAVALYDDKGDAVVRSEAPSAPNVNKGVDPVSELSGLIKSMVTDVNAMKQRQEEMQASIKAYEEAAKRGFPIPGTPGAPAKEEVAGPYDLAMQGKSLMDKFNHPRTAISEEKRQVMAKYFTTFMRAAYFRDPTAIKEFTAKYGTVVRDHNGAVVKTEIGDTGNEFPIPDEVMSEILTFAREQSVILQYARQWPMTSDKMSFPAESSVSTTSWGNTTSQSDPVISEVELDANELSAYTAVRNTTLQDTRSDIVSWLTEMMAEAAGQAIDDEGFNGSGANVCSGILSSACGYSVVMSGGSTAFSQITATHLSEMIGKLDGKKKDGAMFFFNGQTLHFVRDLKDSNQRPIFVETLGSQISPNIWGFPYKEVIKITGTSAANTAFVAFGNLRYFAVGQRLGATTLQVDPYGLWTTNRTRFKIYQRWALRMALSTGFVRLLTAA